MITGVRDRVVKAFHGMTRHGLGLCLIVALISSGLIASMGLARTLPAGNMVIAQTPSVEQLQRQQQQIESQRSTLEQERDRLENLESAAQDRLDSLEDTLQLTNAQITDYQNQLDIATQHLEQLQQSLAIAETQYQEKQFATVARLRFLQRQKGRQGIAVLLQSQNLNDFLDRRRQLKLIYQADQHILADLKAETDTLNTRRLEVEILKNEIALLTQQLLAQKSEFEAQAASQDDLIHRLQDDRTALEAAEAQLARDSNNLALLIQQLTTPADSRDRRVVSGTGRFSYPSNGVITSSFGWRVHPILGYERFHSGTDFGADYGSPIYAADSGVVIYAEWYGGYGLAVIIDHGGGLTTLYGHTSEVYVSEGQTVRQGQAIAAVGSTGLSTGPHLHFEVRENGEPVDPMLYLS